MYFQSRDARYRSPFGAVPEWTAIYLRVRLPRAWQCSGCRLVTALDGGLDRRADMFWAGMDGDDQEWWDCHYTPAVPGLYWYGFVWENEIHDLFGLDVRFIAPDVDYGGQFYHLAQKTPWHDLSNAVHAKQAVKVNLRSGLGVDASVEKKEEGYG